MFIWNKISSDDMGIKIISLPSPSLATERIREIEIDGRDGHLTEFNGYESDTKKVEADYFGNNPDKLLSWLRGSGKVIFSNMNDRYYKARISNKIQLEEFIKNKIYNFLIQFRCQPFGYLLEGIETIELIKPTIIYNGKASSESKPIVTIYGSGAATITINNKAFSVTNIDEKITIDSEIEEVYKGKGKYMQGEFPVLDVGENFISWTGNITKIEIVPNWRCLV